MIRDGIVQDRRAKFHLVGRERVMDRSQSQQLQRAVVVLLVVPIKEGSYTRPGILIINFGGTEVIGKIEEVLPDLELRLGIQIVIRDAWARMGLGCAQVCQQQGRIDFIELPRFA